MLAAALATAVTTLHAQGKEDFHKPLFGIRQRYQQINARKDYRVLTLDDPADFLQGDGNPDGGASLTGYFAGDTLVKIVEWIGLSNSTVQCEYYFDRGSLFFIYQAEKEIIYARGNAAGATTRDRSTARYYFEHGRLIDTLFSDKKLAGTKAQDAAMLVREAGRYAVLLQQERKR